MYAPLPDLVLYGRPGCGLCDETRTIRTALLDERQRAGLATPAVEERDIDTDPAWQQASSSASIPSSSWVIDGWSSPPARRSSAG